MKMWVVLGIGLLLTACSVKPPEGEVEFPVEPPKIPVEVGEVADVVLENLGPAPELENEVWLNTDEPIRLANLRGQVVLLDMWTFG